MALNLLPAELDCAHVWIEEAKLLQDHTFTLAMLMERIRDSCVERRLSSNRRLTHEKLWSGTAAIFSPQSGYFWRRFHRSSHLGEINAHWVHVPPEGGGTVR